jgi:hypothetical protein
MAHVFFSRIYSVWPGKLRSVSFLFKRYLYSLQFQSCVLQSPPRYLNPLTPQCYFHTSTSTHSAVMMGVTKTLVLCFDGSSNEYDDDNTNVVKFFSLLEKDDFHKQLCYYQPGVGTYFGKFPSYYFDY